MDGQQHRDAINAELAGFFNSNTTEGSFTTGGFSFSEPQIQTAIKNYLDLADSYSKSIDKARAMTIVAGPGLDFASESFANAANRSGDSVIDSFTNAHDYCVEQAQLCQNALDDYLGVEHRNVREIYKQGQQGPQAGV